MQAFFVEGIDKCLFLFKGSTQFFLFPCVQDYVSYEKESPCYVSSLDCECLRNPL